MKRSRGWLLWRTWQQLWRKQRSKKAGLRVETLETRLVLSGAPPVANPDSYTGYYDTGVTGNNPAVISTPYPGITSLGSLNLGYAASQIEYSPSSNLLFVREGTSKVHVVNAATGVELSSRTPTATYTAITDIDLTPDGRYLYVADYGGTNIGSGTPLSPSYIQQYDTVTATWSAKSTTGIVYRIEGVDSTRCISLEQDQWVDLLLYDYGVGAASTTLVTSLYGPIYQGDLEYDHRTGRIFHGESGITGGGTTSFQKTGNSLSVIASAAPYSLSPIGPYTYALSSDGTYFYYCSLQFTVNNAVTPRLSFSEAIYAGAGNLAIGSSQYFNASTGASLGTLPFTSTVYGVADDVDELWAFNSTNNSVVHYRLPSYGRGVLANDTDAEYNPLTATVVTPPVHGTLNLASNGTFTYLPTGGYSGTDSFQYKANDGTSDSSPATVNLTLLDNHPPTVTDVANQTVNEDVVSNIAVTIGDVETPATSLTFTATSSNSTLFPPSGVVINGSGADRILVLTPAANLSGTATITLTVTDARGVAATDQFVLTVNSSNDPPSFTKGADQTVLEDSGAITVAGWATNISPGPANEASQTVTFSTFNSNSSLFSVQPTVSAAGVLTFTPAANANGTATVYVYAVDTGGTANGGYNQSALQTLMVTVTPVNDRPSFTKGTNVSVGIDSGVKTITNWATSISKGPSNESTQTLTFDVTSDNPGLFSVSPAISAAGTLTFTPAAGQTGIANVSVTLRDSGGTTNGGVDTSITQTFTIDVGSRNSPPSFNIGTPPTVLEDTGAASLVGWATNISPGLGVFDVGQTVAFTVTAGTPALFAVQPAISPTGTLTFTPAANAFGSTTITVYARDNGGVANGGSDTSASQTFTLTITGINDAPSFTPGSNISIVEDAATQTFASWATTISVGPNESAVQTPTFVVTNNNNSLFSTQPSISSNGTLSFRSATNASGSATVTVQLRDNGGTTNGGVDFSATRTFTITVTAANDAPTIATNSFAVLKSDTNPIQLPIDDGDPEVNQSLTVAVTVQPTHGAISGLNTATGSLIYTPVAGYTGSDAFTVTITDDATAGSAALTSTVSIILNVGSVYSIPVNTPRDIVWDATRSQVYVSNYTGSIYRYDPVSRTNMAPLTVGGALGGFDITPDGSALYIADGQTVGNQGFVKKLNLATSGVTSLPYTLDFGETGAFDVGIAANGIGFVTTNFAGSGWTPFRQINLSTDTLTVRVDDPGILIGEVRQSTQIYRSYDHTKLGFFEQNTSDGPFFVFNSSTNSFPAERDTNEFYTRFAFSRDNTKVAWQSWNGTLTILNASTLATLDMVTGVGYGGGGGVAFDPARDVLYVADANTDQLIAYRTSDWHEVARVSLGTDIGSNNSARCTMTVSDDGSYLFYTSPNDVRVVPLTPLFSTVTINGEAYSGTEDTSLNVATAQGLLVNDILANPNLTTTLKTSPAHGTVTINADGSFVYTPAANYNGTDSFAYTVRSNGTPLGDGIATIQLAAVNDAPTINTSVTPRLPTLTLPITSNLGARLTDIMASVAPVDVITDVDGAGPEGIAITGIDTTNGDWDYSLNDGVTWSSLSGASLSTAQLLQVNAQTRLRFTPSTSVTSVVTAMLTYLGWDGTQGTVGTTTNVSNTGGSTAFSATAGSIAATINTSGVTIAGTKVSFTGTSANDVFSLSFVSATGVAVTFNGVTSTYATPAIDAIEINGVSGADSCTINGSSVADQITFSPQSARLVGSGFTIQVNNVKTNIVYAAANDTAVFNDSPNVDSLYQLPTHSIMVDAGNTYFNEVVGTARTTGNSTSGNDLLYVFGDTTAQTFISSPTQSLLSGGAAMLTGNNFRKVYAYGQGGTDSATFNGSIDSESATMMSTLSTVTSANFFLYLVGFQQTVVNSGGGTDVVAMYDSAGNDTFTSTVTQAVFSGTSFRNTANGYTRVYAFQYFGGTDTATLNGSDGNDIFDGSRSYSVMTTGTTMRQVTGFTTVLANGGNGGNDTATLRDTLGDDTFTAIGASAEMSYAGNRRIQASAFDRVYAMGTSGGRNRRTVTNPVGYELAFRGTWI